MTKEDVNDQLKTLNARYSFWPRFKIYKRRTFVYPDPDVTIEWIWERKGVLWLRSLVLTQEFLENVSPDHFYCYMVDLVKHSVGAIQPARAPRRCMR